ncbi:unnamed protein product [Ilex paraguariensis]|uniref:Uncharacterized protein n=1 Tax=Ilex paraguariensis TaxID=185542 RepID=A0ABC8T2L7_9AQUA
MAIAFSNLSWWLWSGKHQDAKIPNGSSISTSPDLDLWELDSVKFPLVHRTYTASSSNSKRGKRKWHSREERKMNREYDVVLVPSDGGCVSGSESDDSDWSIGWLEPHGPGFQSDDYVDDSFAVLVPCYRHGCEDMEDNSKDKLLDNIGYMSDTFAAENKKYMEQWLSSLQNSRQPGAPRVAYLS